MSNERQREADSERTLKELFAQAKPRLDPPAADAAEIRAAVHAEWDAVTGRRVRRIRAGVAAAASVLLALAVWWAVGPAPNAPPALVARVERVLGSDAAAAAVAVGDELVEGTTLSTGPNPVALRLASGGSLRLGPMSEIVLTGTDAAELVAGALYFDSEDLRYAVEFTVTTAVGTLRDVGTQFLVRLDDGQRLDVGVRDGRVALMTRDDTGSAGAGERLVVTQDATLIRRESTATFGADWDWAERLAPPFEIDGRSLGEFLTWFAAQTGRTIVFADLAVEREVLATVLKGSIDQEPLQKLSAVMATTSFKATLEADGRVVIDRR
jgi:hypothetical protein